ncbi:hypothetical protein [Luteolibacter soli]|uniref:Uncharacterized protein n=1 Tax=Luteolibacter soli TaxID=3135280 RepID=A0ABU9AS24_9BACT
MNIPANAELVRGLTIPIVEEAEHVKGGFFVPIFQPVNTHPSKPAKATESVTPPPPLRYT